jgi:hypothetical protein
MLRIHMSNLQQPNGMPKKHFVNAAPLTQR